MFLLVHHNDTYKTCERQELGAIIKGRNFVTMSVKLILYKGRITEQVFLTTQLKIYISQTLTAYSVIATKI